MDDKLKAKTEAYRNSLSEFPRVENKIYNPAFLNLGHLRDEAGNIPATVDNQKVLDAFCARLQDIVNQGKPADEPENSALFKLFMDPVCTPDNFVRFLTLEAPRTKAKGALRIFFKAYFLAVEYVKRSEKTYLQKCQDHTQAQKKLAEMKNEKPPVEDSYLPKGIEQLVDSLFYAQEGKVAPSQYNAASHKTPTAAPSTKPPSPPKPSTPTPLKPPSAPLPAAVVDPVAVAYDEITKEILEFEERIGLFRNFELINSYNEAVYLIVPAEVISVKNAFCARLQELSKQGKPADKPENSTLVKLFNDPEFTPDRVIPFLAAIASQMPHQRYVISILQTYSLLLDRLRDKETTYLHALKEKKSAVPAPKATQEFSQALLDASIGTVPSLPAKPPTRVEESKPAAVIARIPTPSPVADTPPSAAPPSAPAPATPPSPPPEAPKIEPAKPVEEAPPVDPVADAPQPAPQPEAEAVAPAKEEGIWDKITSFFSWFGGLFVSLWRWITGQE